MNYFSPKSSAERYAKGRPYFHPHTINKIQHKLKLGKDQKLNRVLDIACGTGLSTKALQAIGETVIGTDPSTEMLNHARRIAGVSFIQAFAEEQPFSDVYFDLITVGSGVHWFNIDQFLTESHRLLQTDSWLVVYDNFFLSDMIGVPDFKQWFPNEYLAKYPSPPRNSQYDWSVKNLNSLGFELIAEEQFHNSITFSKTELLLYFTTQSNITAEVTKNHSCYEVIELWLAEQLAPFFTDESCKRTFHFGNWIKYLKKIKSD